MAAHRYWRVALRRYDASPLGYLALRALDLRATEGGPALVVASVSASSADPSYPASNLTDGNDSTAWDSGAVGQTPVILDFELTAPAAVAQIRVRTSGVVERRPGSSVVFGSDDGVAWSAYATDFDGTGWAAATDYTAWVNSGVAPGRPRVVGKPLRLNTSWPTNPQDARTSGQVLRVGQLVGAYRVAGNVYVDGVPDVPVSRRVRLFDRDSASCVRETWSDAVTGAYAFERIPKPPGGYFVVAHDHTAVHNAVIKDRINAV